MKSLLPIARCGALALLVGLVACSDSTSSGAGTGHLSLVLKDAPDSVVAAVVTITQINLQGTGGKTVLSSVPVTTNLLTLAADADTLLDGIVVPAGTYSQLRLVMSGAYLEIDNGDGTTSIYASAPDYPGLPPGAVVAGNLQMPSMGQSGLKITLPGNSLTIADGGEKILVMDFDVAQSFGHLAGGSGMWVMHPVIHAADLSTTGSAMARLTLGSTVVLPGQLTLADFTATFTGSDGLPRTAAFEDPDADGTFTADLLHVLPGDYSVEITAPVGITSFSTVPVLPGTVTVTPGANATVDFTIDGVT